MSHDLLPLAPKDTPKDAARRKRLRLRSNRDKAYTAWLHTQPCCVPRCQEPMVAQHHEPLRSAKGCWSDLQSISLCHAHHNLGLFSRHLMGKAPFEKLHGITIEDEIARLNAKYQEETR